MAPKKQESMILCESFCLLAETPFSDCTKASSPLAFYSTVGSSFCQKKSERGKKNCGLGPGCMFFAPVAGWFSMAIVRPKRASTALLPWSCRLAYPMPLTGSHLFECLALLHNVHRNSKSTPHIIIIIITNLFRWPNPLILLADLSIFRKALGRFFPDIQILLRILKSRDDNQYAAVQNIKLIILYPIVCSYDARPAMFIVHISRLMVLGLMSGDASDDELPWLRILRNGSERVQRAQPSMGNSSLGTLEQLTHP